MQVARPRSNVQLTGFGGHMVFERSKTVDNINTMNFEIRVRVLVSVHACEHCHGCLCPCLYSQQSSLSHYIVRFDNIVNFKFPLSNL